MVSVNLSQRGVAGACVCTHLCERLAQDDLVSLLDKVADSERVIVGVARSETLVGLEKAGERE